MNNEVSKRIDRLINENKILLSFVGTICSASNMVHVGDTIKDVIYDIGLQDLIFRNMNLDGSMTWHEFSKQVLINLSKLNLKDLDGTNFSEIIEKFYEV